MNWIYKKLERKTSTGRFIPEVDGLRFIAILSVILYHLILHMDQHSNVNYVNHLQNSYLLSIIGHNFNRGVQIFFAISGFILSLPFASHFINKTPKPSLKKYFLRRVTRLEPPYILALILFFVLNLITNHNQIQELTPHFLASLFYVHNVIYPGQLPLVNGVLWTLEVEIQFYILAPFLCRIFILSNQKKRLSFLLITILVFSIANYLIPTKAITLFNYIQYFLCGFAITEFYATEKKIRLAHFNKFISSFIGILSLALIFILPNDSLWMNLLMPVCIFIFFYLTINDTVWKRNMSYRLITSIGGMCYSIYLLHMYLIAIIDRYTLSIHVGYSFYVNFLLQCIIIIPIVLFISSLFFLLIEKPCMDKEWVKKVFNLNVIWKSKMNMKRLNL